MDLSIAQSLLELRSAVKPDQWQQPQPTETAAGAKGRTTSPAKTTGISAADIQTLHQTILDTRDAAIRNVAAKGSTFAAVATALQPPAKAAPTKAVARKSGAVEPAKSPSAAAPAAKPAAPARNIKCEEK